MPKTSYVIRNTPRLSLQGARLIMAAAARKAASIGVPMDIAVVDDAGHLLVFNRMDGAKLSSIDIAISKAWTAACARRATHEYAEIAAPGRPAFGIHVSNNGRFMIVGGGLPIYVDGHIVGGIGCSSGVWMTGAWPRPTTVRRAKLVKPSARRLAASPVTMCSVSNRVVAMALISPNSIPPKQAAIRPKRTLSER